MPKKSISQKRTAQNAKSPAAPKPMKAEIRAKLDRLAEMVKNGESKLVSEMIACFEDAWLFEALLAGSSINKQGRLLLGTALKCFNDYAHTMGFLIWAYAPAGAKLDASFKDKNKPLSLKIDLTEENLEPIAAWLQEHIYSHFPSLKLVLVDEELEHYGLTTLSDAAAEMLSKFKGMLNFYKLTTLSDAAVESLSKHKGLLRLGGLTTLSDAAAESLSKHKGDIDLYGLTTLSDAAAESLSKLRGNLDLGGLTTLSDAAAESLSKHKGELNLSGLTTLSDAAAESLSKHRGYLNLLGLATLSDAAVESLSKHGGYLNLAGLTTLSDAAAESLSKHRGHLNLDGLTTLSDSPAHLALLKSLFKQKGVLNFYKLTTLSDAAAESLSKHEGDLSLDGLTTLSDAAAESLCKHLGYLTLRGLTTLSDAAAESLSRIQVKYLLTPGRMKRRLIAIRSGKKTLSKSVGANHLNDLTTLWRMRPQPTIYHAASSSGPAKSYTLTVDAGNVACTCPAFAYRGECRHARELKVALTTNGPLPAGISKTSN